MGRTQTHTYVYLLKHMLLTQSASGMAVVQHSASSVTYSNGENLAISYVFAVTHGVPGDIVIDLDNILCSFDFPTCHSWEKVMILYNF